MNDYYVSVKFENNPKSYYFSCDNPSFKVGDNIIVETSIGKEIGTITKSPAPISNLKFDLELKPILRKALKSDLKIKEDNKKLALEAKDLFIKESTKLKLNMRFIDAQYTLDRTKILFTYASDERVDFRELLKILASNLHCRIELKQINSRERAQLIGGIGTCGLPICCTFFQTTEGISLSRAKNQMLAINIPKLSGQCGKLMCCLKYEDEQYTELKRKFPPINSTVTYEKENYKVLGFNVFSKILKIQKDDDIEFVNLKDIRYNPKKDLNKNAKQTSKE